MHDHSHTDSASWENNKPKLLLVFAILVHIVVDAAHHCWPEE